MTKLLILQSLLRSQARFRFLVAPMQTIVLVFFAHLFCGIAAKAQIKTEEPVPAPSPEVAAQVLKQAYGDDLPPEGARMLAAILSGSQMGPGEGWFGPAESRYDFDWLAKQCGLDEDSDEAIPKETFQGPAELFAILDRNRDGIIQPEDLDWSDANPYVEMSYTLNRVFRKLDVQGKGSVTREDWNAFFDKATAGNDTLTAKDFSGLLLEGYTGSFGSGDGPDALTLVRGLFAGEIGSMLEGPKVGQQAPLFQLRKAQGEGSIDLASLIGDKPVVLVFGNFTCGPFRAFYPAIESLHETYKDRANFLMVYVREAHPTDGWKMESNARAGVAVTQPQTFDERSAVAQQFCSRLNTTIPLVIDELSDPTGHAYSGMPARLYVIDTQGKVAFKSGRGPFGFKPPELEQALAMCLIENSEPKPLNASSESMTSPRGLSDEATWLVLPKATKGFGMPLPNWAKAVAQQLPRTAAAMLKLDYAHRTKSPLDPKLRAKMRWVIAEANRCEYARRTALEDLVRAGGTDDDTAKLKLQAIAANSARDEDEDKDALRFAYDLTTNASKIDVALFERIRAQYGDKKAAAMVLLSAYANFQDRILLGLGVDLEGDVALPPLDIEFDSTAFQTIPVLPENSPVPELRLDGTDVVTADESWGKISFEELQKRLESQRHRIQRLPTPTWEDVAKSLPPNFKARPTRIVWNLVCMGYVPELALPWSTTTRTMWVEAPQDRVFEESLFWVQTRATECNYCMGHCEMLLKVAGLSDDQVENRLKRLASDDWSAFDEKEQRTYAYARKLTRTPWLLTRDDYSQLEKDLGEKEAMAVFFWLCRGLYMTRVSDGFQLQLESDNVFADYATPAKAK